MHTHRLTKGCRTLYNAKVDVFPRIGPKEMFRTACFNELQLRLTKDESYRESTDMLNRILWHDDDNSIKSRTVADAVVREGAMIIHHMQSKSKQILIDNHFDSTAATPEKDASIEPSLYAVEVPTISKETVDKTIDAYNVEKDSIHQIDRDQMNEVFECPESTVYCSIDDVGVKEQKPTGRCKNPPEKKIRHRVDNTVVHVSHAGLRYLLDGLGVRNMLVVLTAFLLHNNLFSNKTLIFFADGADDIKKGIAALYAWRSYRIILDWFHLVKKCKERLSMAMKGSKIRNEVLQVLLALLWRGRVVDAVDYLGQLDASMVRNRDHIDKLIAYLQRNAKTIPCYALRKELGLRISSNLVEKANDLIVADRQKNNGMSWSKPGSSGLANVTTIFLNRESESWLTRRELAFKLIDPTKKAA